MAGFGPNSRYAIPGGTSSNQDTSRALRYPNAFLDVAQTRLPSGGIKEIFGVCQYAMVADPLVSTIAAKMASYPITTLTFSSVNDRPLDQELEKWWRELLIDGLNIEVHQISLGYDYYGFGNSINSVRLPFRKYLVCRACKEAFDIARLKPKKEYTFANWDFTLSCPKCNVRGTADQEDRYIRSTKRVRLKRWPLSDIEIEYYPMSGDCEYYYTPSQQMRSQLSSGDPKALAETPLELFQALKLNKSFRLDGANVFHFRPPGIVVDDPSMGWGFPPILPTLKDGYFTQILKKAMESLAIEHVVPWRWVSPASSGSVDVYRSVNLTQWRKQVEEEVRKTRGDPNYVTVFPLPVNFQQMGGQGKMLMPLPEIIEWNKQRVAGMGAPEEMWTGGLKWSSSSVSLRMLENIFATYRMLHHRMLNLWLIPMLSRQFKVPPIKAEMSPFKMGDDVQGKQLMLQLYQLGLISARRLLGQFDIQARPEQAEIDSENRVKAFVLLNRRLEETHVEGEVQILGSQYQNRLQQLAMREAVPVQGPTGGQAQAEAQAQPPEATGAQDRLARFQQETMKPLPEQNPPRRGGGTGMV